MALFETMAKNERLQYLLVVLAAVALYGNTIGNGYNMDDYLSANNEQIRRGAGAIPEIFTTNYIVENDRSFDYRPLPKAFSAVLYDLCGDNPHAGHAANVLLYAGIAALLLAILRMWLPGSGIGMGGFLPLLVTLLFVAHPVHTEVVASLKNREELLAYLFSLLSLWGAFKYGRSGSLGWLLLGLAAFALALLCKLSAMVFLAVIPLSLFYFGKSKLYKIGLSTLPFAAVFLVFIAFALSLLPQFSCEFFFVENPMALETGIWGKLSGTFSGLGHYIKLLVLPYPLLCYYGYNQIATDTWSIWAVLSLTLHVGLFAYALAGLRRKSLVSFGILLYLVHISMYANLVLPVPGIVTERALFGALLGFCIVVAAAVAGLHARYGKALPIALSGLLLVAYSAITIDRNFDWKDEMTLYAKDVENGPQSAKLHSLYAGQLRKAGKLSDGQKQQNLYRAAISQYEKALGIYPRYPSALTELGDIYAQEYRDFKKAMPYLQKAVEVNPKAEKSHYTLARTYNSLGNAPKAIEHYIKTINLDPDNVKAYYFLSQLYAQAGNMDAAFQTAGQLQNRAPNDYYTHLNLGYLYSHAKDTALVVRHFETATAIDPKNKEVVAFLVQFYRAHGNMAKAQHYEAMINNQ